MRVQSVDKSGFPAVTSCTSASHCRPVRLFTRQLPFLRQISAFYRRRVTSKPGLELLVQELYTALEQSSCGACKAAGRLFAQ